MGIYVIDLGVSVRGARDHGTGPELKKTPKNPTEFVMTNWFNILASVHCSNGKPVRRLRA